MILLDIEIQVVKRLHFALCSLFNALQKYVIEHLRFNMRDRELVDRTKEDNAVNTVAKPYLRAAAPYLMARGRPLLLLNIRSLY